jgi:hypothetical protein
MIIRIEQLAEGQAPVEQDLPAARVDIRRLSRELKAVNNPIVLHG